MSKPVSTDQSHAVMAALATNVDWSVLDSGLLQKNIMRDAQRAGAEFTRFLKNGARLQILGKVVVDLDASPFLPQGWSVEEHRKGGMFEFDPAKIKLFLADGQKNRKIVGGHDLRKVMRGKNLYNANLLDFYLANSHLIPEEWKGKNIFFWGTIYRTPGNLLCVRCLCFIGGEWSWHSRWLSYDWFATDPALVPAA